MITCVIFYVPDFSVVNHGKRKTCRTMLLFCMGLGLSGSEKMSEALALNPTEVMGYVIDNNMLEAHGWSRVWVIV
jgi:hypothetical protein